MEDFMSEDGVEFIPIDSNMYKPTGDFVADAEKLARVVEPFKKEKVRKEKKKEADRLKREEELRKIRTAMNEFIKELPERVAVPQNDGSFIVVRNTYDRLRLARSSDGDVEMGGYHPDFRPMTAYEVITLTSSKKGEGKEPGTVHIFDIDRLKAGDTNRYWGDAKRIHLIDRSETGAYESTNTIEEIPRVAPLTSSLPSIVEFVKASNPRT